jgi:hypothetical protein
MVQCHQKEQHSGHHYRKQYLCRVSYALPSAKYRALGKVRHSAKIVLPSAGHSAKKCTRQRKSLPRAQLPAKIYTRQRRPHKRWAPTVTLCRVPAVRHSAKFFLITLPSASNLTLGKEFLCRVSES